VGEEERKLVEFVDKLVPQVVADEVAEDVCARDVVPEEEAVSALVLGQQHVQVPEPLGNGLVPENFEVVGLDVLGRRLGLRELLPHFEPSLADDVDLGLFLCGRSVQPLVGNLAINYHIRFIYLPYSEQTNRMIAWLWARITPSHSSTGSCW